MMKPDSFNIVWRRRSAHVAAQGIADIGDHDSDNRLAWFEARGKRGHTFRMAVLIAVSLLVALVLAIPLIALIRGDVAFVSSFFDKYFQIIIIVVLALLGGGKLFDLVR
jgi:hypothetical protein